MKIRSITVVLLGVSFVGGCGEPSLLNSDSSSALRMQERTNLVVAATGLGTQPGILEFTVPVSSALDIASARLRWAGRAAGPAGDATILLNGHQRTGTLLASLDAGGDLPWVFVYELDVSSNLRPGPNRFFVSGFDLGAGSRAGGVGVVVEYRDPDSPWTSVLTVDPREFVNAGHGAVWEFPIGTSRDARNGRLVVLAADGTAPETDQLWWSAANGPAPDDLAASASGILTDRLESAQGSWMDLLAEDVVIPAGASHFAYQLGSPADGTGDSIIHFFGAFLSDGEASFCNGSIAGRVWQDDDGDGLPAGEEPGLDGVGLSLRDGLGRAVATTSTDATGAFAFAALCAGDYLVEVDATTLPGGLEPTTCASGDCSPLPVPLATDGSTVAGIAFGFGAPPPPPGSACFFGTGFWKHEYAVLAGERSGRQHVDPATLEALLVALEATTAMDWTRGDAQIDPSDVTAILDQGGSPCARAEKHVLACLLNFTFNGAHPGIEVDTDGDGETDATFGEAIGTVETLLARRGDGDCEAAKRIATAINAMPGEECGF